MSIFILPVIFDGLLIHEIEHYFVNVEFETKQQKRRQEIASLHLLRYFLYKTHLVDLPLDSSTSLVTHLLLSRFLLCLFAS